MQEADVEDLRKSTEEMEEASPPKKSFVPPRGAMALPMFDPAAVKGGLKKTPVKKPEEPREGKQRVGVPNN